MEVVVKMDYFDFGITPRIGLPPKSDVFDATPLAKRWIRELSARARAQRRAEIRRNSTPS